MENYSLIALICCGLYTVSRSIVCLHMPWSIQFKRCIKLITILSCVAAFVFGLLDCYQNLNEKMELVCLLSALFSGINILICLILSNLIVSPKKNLAADPLKLEFKPSTMTWLNCVLLLLGIILLIMQINLQHDFNMTMPATAMIITILFSGLILIITAIIVKGAKWVWKG